MTKRILSLLLCMAMVFSSLPLQSFADEETTATTEAVTEPVEETTVPTEPVMVIVEETSAPTEVVTEPEEETTAPTEAVTEPQEETTAPTEAVTEPEEETTAPAEAVTEPIDETTAPTEAVTEPGEETTAPTEDSAEVPESVIDSENVSDAAANAVATSGTCGANLTWVWDKENMLLTISGTGPMEDYEANGSPWYGISNTYSVTVVIENGVTTVGNRAFYNARWVNEVTLPETLVSIGDSAFYNCSMNVVTIPASVANIGTFAFAECYWLSTINIPEGITEIKDWTFSDCSRLTNITLPASVTTIGDRAFFCCESLKNDIIHEGITAIGEGAFASCTSMSVLTIPDSITAISDYAFQKCIGLKYLHLPETLTSIGSGAFFGCESLVEIGIPETVTEIGNSAFYGCNSLTTISIPDGVTKIEGNTFAFSENLVEIILPGKLQAVGSGAFQDCISLKEIVLPDTVFTLGEEAFQNCSALEKMVLGSRIAVVESFAFENCSSLTSITLSGPVTEIKQAAFSGCSSLAQIQLPNTLTSIASNAFRDCQSLVKITIPESVESIMGGVFQGCTKLTSLHIPKNVRYFGDANLLGCKALTKVTVAEDNATIFSVNGVIYGDNMTDLVWCPLEKAGEFIIPDSVTWVHSYSFANCSNLSKVIMPNSVTLMGNRVFENCSSMTEIVLSTALRGINDRAFANCSSLTEIVIPNSVTALGARAFLNCSNLHSVTIPRTLSSSFNIGDHVFAYCENLKYIYFDGTESSWNNIWFLSDQSSWIDSATLKVFWTRLGVWTNPARLGILTGESIRLTAAMIVDQARHEDLSGITFQIADTSILELVDTQKSANGLNVDLKGLKEGTTTVTFNDSNTGCMAVVPVTVSDSRYCTHTFSTVPEDNISGGINNFYAFNGLYIDNFTYSSHSDSTVTFDVYNANHTYALAEIYDESNEIVRVILIPKKDGNIGSLKEFIIDRNALLISDIINGNLGTYRTEISHSKHTAVSATVPKGGYIRITNDPKSSPLVSVVNMVDIFFNAAELVGQAEAYSENSKNFLEDIVETMIEIGISNFVGLTAEKLVLDKDSLAAYLEEIHSLLNDNEFLYELLQESAIEFGFEFVGKLLSANPLVIAYEASNVIFSIGDGVDLIYQAKELDDSYGYGKIEIQNVKENNRTNGNVTIQSETAFSNDVVLNVFEVTLDGSVLGTLEETHPDLHKSLTEGKTYTYNISLLKSKQEVQPDSQVMVHILIPEELKSLAVSGKTTVYRVEKDGTLTDMQATVENGCFVFTTDHFSLYVLSGYDAEEDTPETIVASGTCGENLTWTLDENGLLTISGSGEMTDYNSLDCGPWQEYAENILKIVVEPGVTRIGDYAFKLCYNAQEVSLPDSLTGIGQSAFMNCAALQSVTVPAAVTEIGEWAFGHCGALTDVQLSAAITEIPHHAFYNCDSLQNISIPGSVTAIGDNAFEGCNSLETISLPSGLETIGKSAFFNCVGLGEIVLPDSVTTLGQDAFCYCESLTRVVIGSGLTTIAGRPFGGCSNLTVLTVAPENSAFVSVDNVLFNRDQTTLICCAGGKTGSYTIPGTVTAIADDAFEGCCISGIVIPDTVTQIGSGAFCRCRNLTEVVLPGSITSIESETFSVCESLTRVVIPASVTSIGYSPFWICENLREICFLGSAPTFLYNNAFEYVTATAYYPAGDESWTFDVRQNYGGTINWVSYETETPDPVASGTCGDNLTWTLDENGLLTISGTGSMTDFLYDFASAVHASWYIHRDAITQVVIDNGVTTIGNYAFYQCRNLTGVTIPESVISIGNNAFSSCWSLSSIAIPDGVTSIGECAFSGCSGLTSITLPEGLTEIADQTFNNCISLSSITIPESVTSIGWSAFGDCDGLTSITIPENVTSIGDSAFDQCSYLNSITLPDSLLEIGGNAFYACQSLTQVTIPASVTSIGDTPFYGCMELTEIQVDAGNTAYCSVDGVLFDKDVRTLLQYPGGREGAYTIPDTVTDIGGGISYAVDLTELTVPESVTSIPGYAFYYCMSLNRVTFQGEISSIGMLTFGSCSSIRDIYFTGDAPVFEDDWIFDDGAEVNMHYPMGNATWTDDVMQDYGGTLTWIPYGGVENRITVPAADLAGHSSVWIDGVEYAVQRDGDNCYVDLPVGSARTMVTHSYNIAGTVSSQTRYPVGMKVWMLENRDGVYTAVRQEVFDDILQYSGMSIRVTGKKGIRMITSIQQSKKNALVAGGLEGLTLKEYGTVVAWASNLTEGNPLVLGQSYAISNYAYRKGVADPVFAYSGSLMQYTNVLVNFSDEQCKHDIALRPYMILEDASGETVTIYGGIVYRSIGYIAYQNRNVFEPQTEEYNYIWDIIHYVYGDVYDDEFAHAWTPPSM